MRQAFMSDVEITLKLPPQIYQQMNKIAQASGQPLDAVMLETFAMLTDQPLALPADTSLLDAYTDAQLWGVVYRRLPTHVDDRWQALLAVRDARPLTDDEAAELARYVDMNDHYVLHRSKALLLLKQRGYDIGAYLSGD